VQLAQRPASSLMNTLAVMCIAATRVSTLFTIYHSHTPGGRGPGGNRPRPEQSQLISLPENGPLGGWLPIGCYAGNTGDCWNQLRTRAVSGRRCGCVCLLRFSRIRAFP
jgi:hypothetical protein